MDCFDHERLAVYRKTIEFNALVTTLIEQLPTGHGDLKSQLQRAATSVALNIAEGAGSVRVRRRQRRPDSIAWHDGQPPNAPRPST